MSSYTIAAFYKFVKLENLELLRADLEKNCQTYKIFGTIILAQEGINGTIAGTDEAIHYLIEFLRSLSPFTDLECKYSFASILPFHKLKVVIKKEIVTFRVPNIDPTQKTGIEIDPVEWNNLMCDPEIMVIDTRNTYEVELGSFKNALDPKTEAFTEFPNYVKNNLDPKKHKKIAMFCTGGIRCEKASSYLLAQGFENVYQLKGGILKYLEKVTPENSLWKGECFIFDNRITL